MSIEQLETLMESLGPEDRTELVRRLTHPQEGNGDRPSLRDHRAVSVGRVLRPLECDDILNEEC